MSWNGAERSGANNNAEDGIIASAALADAESFIRAATGKPHTAVLSLASVMLATTGAGAQEALPTIDVQGAGTGGSGGYQATAPAVSRIPTPLLDTPQTVNVVTQKLIEEQNFTTMEDALRSVPGITFSAGEGGVQGDAPIIRGFAARGDMFRDGIRDPGWYTRDLFSSERVEVYKGPSAFAFGRGATGGAINTVSKLPTGIPYIEGFVSGTTAGGYRTELDASGKKDNVSGRIAAMYQDVPTPDRDNVYVKRWGVAPSVKIDFNAQTRATVSYIYQGEESIPDYGRPYLPSPAYSATTGAMTSGGYYGNGAATPPIPVPRSNWYGVKDGPLADRLKTETHIITGQFEHDLAPDLKIANATRYVSVDRDVITTAPRSLLQADNATAVTPGYPVDQMTIGRQHFQTLTDNTLLVNQTDLRGKFYTGSLLHTFSMGFEAAGETRDQQRANYCVPTGAGCRTSAYYPIDTSYGGPNVGFGAPTHSESVNLAVYAFDQIKINQYFELMGAIRYDYFKTDYNPTPAQELTRIDNLTSWRVGGVFHPTSNTSLYAAYGVSFNPSAEFGTLDTSLTSTANVLLDPERNTTLEVGAKADVLNNRLSLTAAIFRIEKTNLRIPVDPATNTMLQLNGLARVDGIELGAAGRITDQWSVFAGYTYLDSEIVKTTNLNEIGKELPNTPKNNFTLWTTYALTPEFTVGGGAIYQDIGWANTTNTAYVPSFWRFDAMAAYKVTKNSTLQLNVYNIGDELYYAQYYGGHAVPASGRYASLSYRIRFEPEAPVIREKIVK